MKRALRFFATAILLIPLLMFPSVTVGADDYPDYIYEGHFTDYTASLTDEQEESIRELVNETAESVNAFIRVTLVDDLLSCDSAWDYAKSELMGENDEYNEITMTLYKELNEDDSVQYFCGIALARNAKQIYQKYVYRFSDSVTETARKSGEFEAVRTFCEKLPKYAVDLQPANASSEILFKGDKYKAALADYDDCLTEAQEEQILNEMKTTAEKVKCNIGIVITRDLEGKSDVRYIRDFSDDNFGHGSDSISLLLLNRHGNPAYAGYRDQLDRTGAAYKFDKYVDKIYDELYYALDKNGASSVTHFDSACIAFCKAVKSYGGNPFFRIMMSVLNNPQVLLFALVFSTIPTFIALSTISARYKKKKPLCASQYIDRRTVHVTYQRDDFIREYTTSVRTSSSHHGGGHHGGGHSGGGHHTSGGRGR